MTPAQACDLIARALEPIGVGVLETEEQKRVYLAYLLSRLGQGHNGTVERRVLALRKEIGI